MSDQRLRIANQFDPGDPFVRRVGTTKRDEGKQLPGEVNGWGLPMTERPPEELAAARGPVHNWDAFNKAFHSKDSPAPAAPGVPAAPAAAAPPAGAAPSPPAAAPGSSPQDIWDFFHHSDHDSEAQAGAAAFTGNAVQTPWGTVSSKPDWQMQVTKKYPEIGQAGTQANSDFVAAYKKAQTGGQGVEKDPLKIADTVMASRTPPAAPAANSASIGLPDSSGSPSDSSAIVSNASDHPWSLAGGGSDDDPSGAGPSAFPMPRQNATPLPDDSDSTNEVV